MTLTVVILNKLIVQRTINAVKDLRLPFFGSTEPCVMPSAVKHLP
jgi:hypothetical protein